MAEQGTFNPLVPGSSPGRSTMIVYLSENRKEETMFIMGIILLVLGLLLGVHILFVLGLILVLIGAALYIAGSAGHAFGPRNHYW